MGVFSTWLRSVGAQLIVPSLRAQAAGAGTRARHMKYFSISAARPWHRVPPFAVHAYKLITDAEGPNDALVSVKSSTWAEHLGTWPADHWHTINHRMVVELKEPTGDITPYYVSVLDRLQQEGMLEE